MANEFLPNSPATVKPIRDNFVNKEHLNSIGFNFSAASEQVCDLGAYQHNQQIQLNSGAITVMISQDNINWYAGPSVSVGITVMNPAVRYLQVTSSGAAQGLIVGLLY